MKLPGSEKAYIPLRKLTEYLLSETHPAGGSKALFFRSVGFGDDNVDLLHEGLMVVGRKEDVKETESSPYGTKYIVEGKLATPIGSYARIRTVWIVESGDDRPRFVTAYPV